MPEKIITPKKKRAAGVPKMFRFGSGKTHAMTREAVLRWLGNKEFIDDQKHVARAK